jgi:plasmid stabilization system protein ParE
VGAAASAAVTLELSPRAIREAERCARWWREYRPAARALFEEELHRALDQIRGAPELGSSFRSKKRGREYRRVLMPETRYHVYYRMVGPDQVLIAAIWSAVRGRGPAL